MTAARSLGYGAMVVGLLIIGLDTISQTPKYALLGLGLVLAGGFVSNSDRNADNSRSTAPGP